MARTHRVFIPAARLEEFFAPVRAVLSERGVPLRLGRLRARLELSELACFDLRVAGSVWRGRAPYVFPIMATMEDMSYPEEDGTPLECLPGWTGWFSGAIRHNFPWPWARRRRSAATRPWS